MMTQCGTTDSCLCLSEAYHDALFNHWAIAHGLGFDFCKAVQDSGWDYWTAQGDAGRRLHVRPGANLHGWSANAFRRML